MSEFEIECHSRVQLRSYTKPEDFVVEVSGTIEHDKQPIGRFRLYRVLVEHGVNYDVDAADIFNGHSPKLARYYRAIYDPEKDRFWEELGNFGDIFHFSTLIIDSIVLNPKWRGLRLGLLVLRKLMDVFCSVEYNVLVMCKPRPLKQAANAELTHRGKVKLRRYIQKLGFVRIGMTAYYALQSMYTAPTYEEILAEVQKNRRGGPNDFQNGSP